MKSKKYIILSVLIYFIYASIVMSEIYDYCTFEEYFWRYLVTIPLCIVLAVYVFYLIKDSSKKK